MMEEIIELSHNKDIAVASYEPGRFVVGDLSQGLLLKMRDVNLPGKTRSDVISSNIPGYRTLYSYNFNPYSYALNSLGNLLRVSPKEVLWNKLFQKDLFILFRQNSQNSNDVLLEIRAENIIKESIWSLEQDIKLHIKDKNRAFGELRDELP